MTMPGDTVWTLNEAVELCRQLEARLAHVGWHVALTGGVLRNGSSTKDLDLMVFPHTTTKADREKFYDVMEGLDWWVRVSVEELHEFWRQNGSDDAKHVDVWQTPDGRRVDIFICTWGTGDA